jgi:hypothetical protein
MQGTGHRHAQQTPIHDRLIGRAAAALSAKMYVPVRRIGFLIMPLI